MAKKPYSVTWEIEVDAESARDAAKMAREIQRTETPALTFHVKNLKGKPKTETIDLGSGIPFAKIEEPAFGVHLKETGDAIKHLFGGKHE
jgi:hypothetical protein